MQWVRWVVRTLLLGAVLAVCIPTSASLGRDSARPAVMMLTPPAGIAVPVGQALEVRCRVLGNATHLALWSEGRLIFIAPIMPGQEVTYPWMPVEPGAHCLAALALDAHGEPLAGVTRVVVGLPPHSAAQLATRGEGAADVNARPHVDDFQCISRGGVP